MPTYLPFFEPKFDVFILRIINSYNSVINYSNFFLQEY